MRHKYVTRAIVLGRRSLGEESLLATLLTQDFGLIRARSQGARKRGSKMSAGLQTLSLSDVTLLKGKEGWRMAGSVLEQNWARELSETSRTRAARILELAERLIQGTHEDPELFALLCAFLSALPELSEEDQDAAETLAAIRLLHELGIDAGDTFGENTDYGEYALGLAKESRTSLITRINQGINASGL